MYRPRWVLCSDPCVEDPKIPLFLYLYTQLLENKLVGYTTKFHPTLIFSVKKALKPSVAVRNLWTGA